MIDGRGGNDVITGGGGNDSIVFRSGFGKDKVTDFNDAGDDTIVFSTAVFADWAAVQKAMTQSADGKDVVITLDANNTVTLVGTLLANVTQFDFSAGARLAQHEKELIRPGLCVPRQRPELCRAYKVDFILCGIDHRRRGSTHSAGRVRHVHASLSA